MGFSGEEVGIATLSQKRKLVNCSGSGEEAATAHTSDPGKGRDTETGSGRPSKDCSVQAVAAAACCFFF